MSATPGPSSSSKRKSSDSHQSHNGKKRTRVSYSCSECHRRKQKCDRQVPCGHCVSRKVPELCHAYQPGKSEGDLHLRLARVERIIDLALPDYAGVDSPTQGTETPQMSGRYRRSVSTSPDEDAQDEDSDTAAGTLQSGRWFGSSAVGSVNSRPIFEQLEQPDVAQVVEEQTSADRLKILIQDYGVSPHKLSELVTELPPKPLCDVLVDFYFTRINFTRYPIYEAQFRTSYDQVWANGMRVTTNDVRFLPLLFVVLATAARLAPEHIGGDEKSRRYASLRYYWSSRRSILIAAALGEGLDLITARLLSSRFLTFDRRITACWNILGTAVRAAQALGLHRDGAKLGMDSFQTEYRRRIWSYLYHADQTHALLLGRPPSIVEQYTDTLPPSNIDDSTLIANPNAPVQPHPLSQPTGATFLILRNALAVIIGKVVHHFQQVHGQHYSNVLQLDDELQRFVSTLPPHFSLDPDTSLDSALTYIPIHRFLITTEVFFVRISLHRPYVLRRSERFEPSRRACFDSAKRDFEVRQTYKRTMAPEVQVAIGGGYREFQAAMISGISLVIEPHGLDKDIMHEILDTFLSEHARMTDMDDTTQREVKIIELLKSKSMSAAENGRRRSGGNTDGIAERKLPRERVSDVRTTVIDTPRDESHDDAHMLLSVGRNGGQPPPDIKPLDSPFYARALVTSHPSSSSHSPAPLQIASPTFTTNAYANRSPNWYRPSGHQSRGSISSAIEGSSPSTEEESAQRLLDHWVNNVNASDQPYDNPGNGMWNPMTAMEQTTMLSGLGMDGGTMLDGSAPGSDWTYWENLVDHIRAAGLG